MVILAMLWIFKPRIIAGQDIDMFSIAILIGKVRLQDVKINPWFLVIFFSSLFSAAKGIADFLLLGPCRLLTKDGPFSGIGTFGYILLTLNIFCSILGKLILLAFAYGDFTYDSIYEQKVSFSCQ